MSAPGSTPALERFGAGAPDGTGATSQGSAAPGGGWSALPQTPCSHSIGLRLSRKLSVLTMLVVGALSLACWSSVKLMFMERHAQDLEAHVTMLDRLLDLEAEMGGEAAVLARVRGDTALRNEAKLELWRADGSLLHADAVSAAFDASQHCRSREFTVHSSRLAGGQLRARYTVDYARDAALGERWAVILVLATLGAGGLVASGAFWHVRRQLRPLHELAAQTRAISPRRLDQRLTLSDPAEELRPWVDQFNALLARLETAYAQLEGFNADVAHELRTPLAALIGQTEVALSRERSAPELAETLLANLDELRRLSAMVNDMLFLSQADRGALARRGEPVSLAAVTQQVSEFHEAAFEEAGLVLRIEGDATLAVDEALVKRALSNLLSNAARFAHPGSVVRVCIEPDARTAGVRIVVENHGQPIDAATLPRLFDRFFRGDTSRCCDDGQSHHGLGLAIVAAIARMHAGQTLAESGGGVTRVGFTLAAA